MLPVELPAKLMLPAWDKVAAQLPKGKDHGQAAVADGLKKLKVLHEATDLACFGVADAADVATLERAAATLGPAARFCDAVAEHAKALGKVLAKLATSAKGDDKVPKSFAVSLKAVDDALEAYARAVAAAPAAARKELTDRIQKASRAQPAADRHDKPTASPGLKKLRAAVLRGLVAVKGAKPDTPPLGFVVAAGKQRCLACLAPQIGQTHKGMLKELLSDDSEVRLTVGRVLWERNAFSFVADTAPGSGLGKRLQQGLFELTGSRFPLRVRTDKDAGEEVAGDAADALDTMPVDDDMSEADTKIFQALLQRQGLLEPALAPLLKRGDEEARKLEAVLHRFEDCMTACKWDDATAIMGALEAAAAKAKAAAARQDPQAVASQKALADKRNASAQEADKLKQAMHKLLPDAAAPSDKQIAELRQLAAAELKRAKALDEELKQAAKDGVQVEPSPARIAFDANAAPGAVEWTEAVCEQAFRKYGWFEFKALRKSRSPVDIDGLKTQKVVTDDVMWKLYQYRRRFVDRTIAALQDQYGGQLLFKSSGSEDIESDFDITVASPNSGDDVKAMRQFNTIVRARFGRPPGRVFDTNLYARDYNKIDDNLTGQRSAPAPTDHGIDEPVGAMSRMSDIDQDVATLMKQRRFLDADTFQAMWQSLQASMVPKDAQGRPLQTDEARQAAQAIRQRFEEAEDAYLLTAREKVEAIIGTVKRHFATKEGSKDSRRGAFGQVLKRYQDTKDAQAMQRLIPELLELLEDEFPDEVMQTTDDMYADRMAALRDDQEKIRQMEAHERLHARANADCKAIHGDKPHDEWLKQLSVELNATKAHVKQQLFTNIVFANEAYVSQGAITHIVAGAQASDPKKKQEVLEKLKPAELLQSTNEQLADFFKDMKHMEHAEKAAGSDATKKRRASGEAFVHASKYLSRMLDGAVLLQEKYAGDPLVSAHFQTPRFDLLERCDRSGKMTLKTLKDTVDGLLLALRKSSTIPADVKAELAFDEVHKLFGVDSIDWFRKLITGFGVDFNERVRKLKDFQQAQVVDLQTEREYFSAAGRRNDPQAAKAH